MKFELGQLVATRGVNARLLEDLDFAAFLWESFARHNNEEGCIYIITEWDRSVTTILFQSEN